MPTTVNGVGTHYYGKSDVTKRTGTCRSCGANTTLESYTTRLWFVILFIPIIPLKRVRLLDYCPRCSRHWVANPEQFEMSRQLAVSGAMEKFRDQPSVDAALMVHAQFLSFHMHSEADEFRKAALQRFPQSAELRAGLAEHLDQTGGWPEATALYEQAFELKSDLPEVRGSLAWRRLHENKLDEAFDLLDFLCKPGAGQSFNLASLEHLAKAYHKAGNHERALEIFGHLLREIPAYSEQHAFRKLVTKSEQALHQHPSILPEKTFSVRGLFDSKSGTHAPWVRWAVFGLIALFLFTVGMAGLNEYQRQHRTLHIVSAFAQPVSVSVDGGPAVVVTQRSEVPISEGKHQVQVTGPFNRKSEIEIRSGYWSRWTRSPVWTFNVGNVAALYSTKLHYAVNPTPSESIWLNDSELSYVPHVDYPFTQPPPSIQVEGNKTVTKTHVGIKAIPPSTTFLSLRGLVDQDVVLAFAEGHLERNPNDALLLNVYGNDDQTGEVERVTAFLKAGLWKKPISVPWHRAWQHQKSVAANEAALIAEYDAQLEQAPDDASLLYLRGRVGSDRTDQLKFFRLANEKAPQLGWPLMALGYDAANRGAWDEAKGHCEKAVNTLRSDPSFRNLWHFVRMANGEAASVETEYRQQLQGQEYAEVMTAFFYLADSLAQQGKNDQIRPTARDFLTKLAGPGSGELQVSFEPFLDYVSANFDGMRQRKETSNPTGQPGFQFQCLLALGEPDQATKLNDFDKIIDDWHERLGLSVAYSLAGNQAQADEWRTKACDKLKESGDADERRAAALLQNENPPSDNDLDEILLRINDTALLLTAAAQRFPDRKTELNQRAARLNVSRLPPYLLVKKAVEHP